MYLIESHKTAFIHIPKTGGTAIVRHFAWPLGFKRYGGRPRHMGYRPNIVPEDWFVFAFVRDPYTRLTSLYRQRFLDSAHFRHCHPVMSSFLKAHIQDYDEDHPKPLAQVDYLHPRVEVFRYEWFDEEVARVAERMGVSVPKIQQSPENKYFGDYDWREWIDERAVFMINRRFSQDFRDLDYRQIRPRAVR